MIGQTLLHYRILQPLGAGGLARIKRPEPAAWDPEAETKSVQPGGAVPMPDTLRGGTPAYMSPEQVEARACDYRTDLFSFGVVCYEVLTGQRPFKGATPVSLVSSILKDEPEAVTTLRPAVPRAVGKVVTRCLQKAVRNRYQAAGDVRHDLEEVQMEVEAGTVMLETAAPSASRRRESSCLPSPRMTGGWRSWQ